jgi:hypothetical protein
MTDTAVVEKPKEEVKPEVPPPTEQESTDAYIEARREGKEELPIPPPTVQEAIAPPVVSEPPPPTAEETKIQETDAYLETRKAERERKRGGKQAKIEQLTKEKHELEEKLAAEQKAKEATPPTPVPEPEKPAPSAPPPAVVVPKARPKINEYTDIDEYNAAMALWAADERARTQKIAETKPEPQIQQVRKEEFDHFLEKGKQFIVSHPDFNSVLEAAHVRGLTMTESARIAITRLALPEVVYWLARPENDQAARKFMGMDDMQQVAEVGRIAQSLTVKPEEFVSNAPPPGTRLSNANTRSTVPIEQLDTDDYIRMRRQERRAARGR